MAAKCGFSGCKNEAKWHCKKLWGKGGVLLTCDDHKPDAGNRTSEAVKKVPMFYEVTPFCELPPTK